MKNRGHAWVVAQFALFFLVMLGPPYVPGHEPLSLPAFANTIAYALLLGGLLFALWGGISLGDNLTPLPRPKDDATLVEKGAFRFARHPIYGGAIMMSFGWALWMRGQLTIAYAIALFVFFDLKSRSEERWLIEKFSGYAAYRKRVRRFVPFLY